MISKSKQIVTMVINGNNTVPIMFRGVKIGMATISCSDDGHIDFVVDTMDDKFKMAFNEPGMSGSSINVMEVRR